MAQRPPRDLNWVPDDSTGITVPSQTKQNAGWVVEKPARQFFNWLANRQSRWSHYFSGQSQEFIIIDSTNANEKDYDTLAAYIADSPAAGDKVLVKETQALTAQMIIPSFITLRILDGVYFTRSTNEAVSVIKFGADIVIEGVLNLFLSHTGTIAKAIEFDGDNVVGKINVENSSTGILTDVYQINASKTGNRFDGFVQNTGGGTISNIVNNNSGELSNLFNIVDKSNKIVIPSEINPSFSAHRNGVNQSIPDAVYTKVEFDTEEFDTNSNYDDSTNYRFTPTVAKKYPLSAAVHVPGLNEGDEIRIAIYKNGVIYKERRMEVGSVTWNGNIEISLSTVDANGTTDYFEVYVYQNLGVATNLSGSSVISWFMGG